MKIKKVTISNIIVLFSIIIGIGFNFELFGSPPFYLIHLMLLIASLTIILSVIALKIRPNMFLVYNVVLVFCFIILSTIRFTAPNIAIFFPKILFSSILYISFLFLFIKFGSDIKIIAIAITIGALLSTFFVAKFVPFSELGLQSRLIVQALGNFNAYGFFLSIAIISLYYLCHISDRLFYKIIFSIAILHLTMYLISSFSRGAMISLLLGTMMFYLIQGKNRTKNWCILFVLLVCLISISLYFLDGPINTELLQHRFLLISERAGDGRIYIWHQLLSDLSNNPISLLVGNGLGSIYIDTVEQISAHNTFLECLYYYGLFGLFIFLFWLYFIFRALMVIPNEGERRYLSTIYIQCIFSFGIDSYYGSSQLGWLYPFFFSLIISNYQIQKKLKGRIMELPFKPITKCRSDI